MSRDIRGGGGEGRRGGFCFWSELGGVAVSVGNGGGGGETEREA